MFASAPVGARSGDAGAIDIRLPGARAATGVAAVSGEPTPGPHAGRVVRGVCGRARVRVGSDPQGVARHPLRAGIGRGAPGSAPRRVGLCCRLADGGSARPNSQGARRPHPRAAAGGARVRAARARGRGDRPSRCALGARAALARRTRARRAGRGRAGKGQARGALGGREARSAWDLAGAPEARPRAASRRRAGRPRRRCLRRSAAAPGSGPAAVAKASGVSAGVAAATLSRLAKQGRVRRLEAAATPSSRRPPGGRTARRRAPRERPSKRRRPRQAAPPPPRAASRRTLAASARSRRRLRGSASTRRKLGKGPARPAPRSDRHVGSVSHGHARELGTSHTGAALRSPLPDGAPRAALCICVMLEGLLRCLACVLLDVVGHRCDSVVRIPRKRNLGVRPRRRHRGNAYDLR